MIAGAIACGNVDDGPYIATNPPAPGGTAGVGGSGGNAPECPKDKPTDGASCDVSSSCKYPGEGICGVVQPVAASCVGGQWQLKTLFEGSCNPPRPVPCPAEAPKEGAACHSGFDVFPASCHYDSPACVDATCTDVWHVTSCGIGGEGGAGGAFPDANGCGANQGGDAGVNLGGEAGVNLGGEAGVNLGGVGGAP